MCEDNIYVNLYGKIIIDEFVLFQQELKRGLKTETDYTFSVHL